MKFLIDAHLPPSLWRALAAEGHDAVHTSALPDGNATTDEAMQALGLRRSRTHDDVQAGEAFPGACLACNDV